MKTHQPPAADKPMVRIPMKQLIFVREMIRTGNKQESYRKAYPDTKEESLKPSANRLYNRPEVKESIDAATAAATEKAFAEWEEEAKQRIKTELLNLHEKRALLARMVRGQQNMNRYYKLKEQDKPEAMQVVVDNPFALLRAIELDCKIEADVFAKKQTAAAIKKPDKPEPGQYRQCIYIGTKAFGKEDDDLTEEEYEALIKRSLTDPSVVTPPPPLTPTRQNAGCYIEQDMETGRYEMVCPEEAFAAAANDTAAKEIVEKQEPQPKTNETKTGTNGVAISSILPAQNIEDQQTIINRRFAAHMDKEGYVPYDVVRHDCWNRHFQNKDSCPLQECKIIVLLGESRKLPARAQAKTEQEAGWAFHPADKQRVKWIKKQ